VGKPSLRQLPRLSLGGPYNQAQAEEGMLPLDLPQQAVAEEAGVEQDQVQRTQPPQQLPGHADLAVARGAST
jgi:hypothetical protein